MIQHLIKSTHFNKSTFHQINIRTKQQLNKSSLQPTIQHYNDSTFHQFNISSNQQRINQRFNIATIQQTYRQTKKKKVLKQEGPAPLQIRFDENELFIFPLYDRPAFFLCFTREVEWFYPVRKFNLADFACGGFSEYS